MKIDAIGVISFQSNNTKTVKEILKKTQNKTVAETKPIKNYTQYLEEYGLIRNTRKK